MGRRGPRGGVRGPVRRKQLGPGSAAADRVAHLAPARGREPPPGPRHLWAADRVVAEDARRLGAQAAMARSGAGLGALQHGEVPPRKGLGDRGDGDARAAEGGARLGGHRLRAPAAGGRQRDRRTARRPHRHRVPRVPPPGEPGGAVRGARSQARRAGGGSLGAGRAPAGRAGEPERGAIVGGLAASIAALAALLWPPVARRLVALVTGSGEAVTSPPLGAIGFGILANALAWVAYGGFLWLLARGVVLVAAAWLLLA